MLDVNAWMTQLLERLLEAFDDRLLFLGLQGSRRRGEGRADSDIDAVVIFDRLDLSDLAAYRDLVAAMPEAEKACGFVSGARELLHWPRHELFQFSRDTMAYYGSLDDLMPPLSRDDIANGVLVGASGVYHAAGHMYVHGGEGAEALRDLFKSCFFILQSLHYLDTGDYVDSRAALLPLLEGRDREILRTSVEWDALRRERETGGDAFFALLLEWSGDLIARFGK